MFRYIALLKKVNDNHALNVIETMQARLSNTIAPFKKIYESSSLLIFTINEHPGRMQHYPLNNKNNLNNGGVVLGRVFNHSSDTQNIIKNPVLNYKESIKIFQTNGQHLVDHYWGRYVAFLENHAEKEISIIRDPSAGLPCNVTHYNGVDIYFSNMMDILPFEFLKFTINWNHIKANMSFQFVQKTNTGLNEVSEILPGECQVITPNGVKTTFLWDPLKISQTQIIENPVEAADELRQTTVNCVAAWASCYTKIIHRLGGLDSSIVLASLNRAPTPLDLICYTFFTSTPDGDERFYTQLAAHRAGVECVEKEINSSEADLSLMLNVPKSEKPWPYLHAIDRGHFELDLADEVGAEAIFSGLGGDNLFFQPHSNHGANDYMKVHGLTTTMIKIAMEAARLRGVSVWSSLGTAIKDRFSRRAWRHYDDILGQGSSIINPKILRSLNPEEFLHPLLRSRTGIPKGKLYHMMLSSFIPAGLYYEPSDRPEFLEPVHPLLSQPLVELCLRIPTWVLTTGGRDRALARHAFSHLLPKEIIRRESKGNPSTYYHNVFQDNIAYIREFLLDGIMVREKLLNPANIEKALAGNLGTHDFEDIEILYHVSTEAWLKNWLNG